MKYELETIPIWDTYKENPECPICVLQKKAEKNYINFFLGNSVMVPEMRVKVNDNGFCGDHFTKLLSSRKNNHGLGLVTHTRFVQRIKSQLKHHKRIIGKANKSTKDENIKTIAQHYKKHLLEENEKCMICSRIDYTLNRYSYTIIYLWKKDNEFKECYNNSKGICTKHLPRMIDMAEEILNGKLFSQWLLETVELQDKNFHRIEKELLWYTQKFDFQNNDKPWGTSKDALHRTIQKLTGIIQEEK